MLGNNYALSIHLCILDLLHLFSFAPQVREIFPTPLSFGSAKSLFITSQRSVMS